jgi:phosphohistidine phosphatase
MMNVVYLVRHGEANSPLVDPERGLSTRGRSSVERLAVWAATVFSPAPEIRHSGKPRAAQTARILSHAFQLDSEPVAVAGLNPNDAVQPVADMLGSEAHPVMLVGHLPFLSRLASYLIVGDAGKPIVEFDTATLVRLSRDQYGWAIDTVTPPGALPGT